MNESSVTESIVVCKVECPNCHKELIGKNQVKYCSKRCELDYRIKISAEKRTRSCVWCGAQFVANINHPQDSIGHKNEGKYCSVNCRNTGRKIGFLCAVYFNVCMVCGAVFTARTKKECCASKQCRHDLDKSKAVENYYLNYNQSIQISRDYHNARWTPRPAFKCKWCQNMHQPVKGTVRTEYCSDICAHKASKGDHKRKAEKNGVFYEHVNPIKVFERDGWRCQLCGKKLKEKNRGTHRDDAPELDHIITWAEHGEHSYKNTQCACRKCNQLKSSKSKGQLKLFGQ